MLCSIWLSERGTEERFSVLWILIFHLMMNSIPCRWSLMMHCRFKRGSFPGSINIPFHSAFSPEGDLNPCPSVQSLNQNKNPIKVVIGGSRGKHACHVSSPPSLT